MAETQGTFNSSIFQHGMQSSPLITLKV